MGLVRCWKKFVLLLIVVIFKATNNAEKNECCPTTPLLRFLTKRRQLLSFPRPYKFVNRTGMKRDCSLIWIPNEKLKKKKKKNLKRKEKLLVLVWSCCCYWLFKVQVISRKIRKKNEREKQKHDTQSSNTICVQL